MQKETHEDFCVVDADLDAQEKGAAGNRPVQVRKDCPSPVGVLEELWDPECVEQAELRHRTQVHHEENPTMVCVQDGPIAQQGHCYPSVDDADVSETLFDRIQVEHHE